MSVDELTPGNPLARALDDYPVPPLSAGFADRVTAAAATRAASLPELRRKGAGRGWQLGRRIAIGVGCFGALATAAAATGVLDQFNIAVPSAQKVWANLTGKEASAAAPAVAMVNTPVGPVANAITPVVIDGPIDTPEELGEVFRRIDEVREGRIEARRELTGQRIDRLIERRRDAGSPVPTAEQEVRLRQRIDEAQSLREQRSIERIADRRAEMERKIANGEALTREDITGPLRNVPSEIQLRDRLEQLRQMSPQQRREVLRRLPPQQRRALINEYRAQRSAAASVRTPEAVETPVPLDDPTLPPAPREPQD